MKKNRILSVILVISMLCANLFSSILSVNASAQIETVILNEDFESGVTASTSPLQDGGFVLAATAGMDTGYNSSAAFCPAWVPGQMTTKNALGVSKYFLPADKIANSGQYRFKFDYYRGSNTFSNYIELCPDEIGANDVEIAEMNSGAKCTVGTWYFVEILVDLEEHTYSLTVLNTDNSVKYTKNGSYPHDVVSKIVFTTKALSSVGSGANVSGFATKIDNLYISRLYYEEPDEPVAVINAASVETMGNAITATATALGLTLTDYNALGDKSSVYTALVGKSFVDAAAVVAAFNSAVATQIAAEDLLFKIYYSTDNVNWTVVPGFTVVTNSYTVSLPTNTFYVYMKYDAPVGITTRHEYEHDEEVVYPANVGDLKLPDIGALRIQRLKPMSDSECPIPLKGGTVQTWTLLNGTNFAVQFNSTQPTITTFTNNISTIGKMSFARGAGANNDNRSLIDSTFLTSINKAWALANLSKNLVGSSMLMLPIDKLSSTACSEVTSPTLATFETDTPCTVFVMRPSAVSTTAYDTWTTLNDGNQGVATDSAYTTARNYNGYTNTDYYGIAYKWVCDSKSNPGSAPYMLDNPGITGEITGTHVAGTSHLNYVYGKSFAAGDTISIGNPGDLGGSDASAIMTVLIQWDFPEPIVEITGLSASSTSNTTTITATNTVEKSSPNQTIDYEALAAIYSDSTCNELIDVVMDTFTEGVTSLTFDNADYGDDAYVQFFVWKMDGLEPHADKISGLLSALK